MFCRSLRHAGEELLGGVAARLPGRPLDVRDRAAAPVGEPARRVRLRLRRRDARARARRDLYVEEHGLPLHGLRSAVTGWEVVESSDTRLVAGRELDLPRVPVRPPGRGRRGALRARAHADHDGHRARRGRCRSRSATTRTCSARRAAREWEITLPVGERLMLDERLVPTGEREPAGDLDGPLGARTFDDGFTLASGRRAVRAGRRRAPDRGRLRARLSVRADLRARDLRRHLLRADDRAGRRAAPLAGRGGARRVVLGALQRVRVTAQLERASSCRRASPAAAACRCRPSGPAG